MKKADEFHAAVARGDASQVRTLLDDGVPVDVRSKDALPALYIAAENADVDMMQLLLNAGADVRCAVRKRPYDASAGKRAIRHESALTAACAGFSDGDIPVSRRKKAISLLLERGASRNEGQLVDKDELYRAATALLDYALSNSGDKWDVQVATVLRQMAKAGLDPRHDSGTGWPLMHSAVHRGAGIKVLQTLLDLGASAIQIGRDGIQPVHLAVARHDSATLQLLVTNGADVNAQDAAGRTALFHVQSAEMCEALIAMGADVNHKSNAGETPAAYFVLWGVNDAGDGETSMPESVVTAIVNAGGSFGSTKTEFNRVARIAKSKEFAAIPRLIEVLRAHEAVSSVIARARQPGKK